ncbi:unnamed protein product [Penicillium olsonii]|nr:unnamed protein product [Penicillium olsonii]
MQLSALTERMVSSPPSYFHLFMTDLTDTKTGQPRRTAQINLRFYSVFVLWEKTDTQNPRVKLKRCTEQTLQPSGIEAATMDDIGALATSCATHFETLIKSLRAASDKFEEQMRPVEIENEYARFKIWAGNLGALQRGRSSLDARLRDSVTLRAAVLKFLGQLQDCLERSAEITTGLRLPDEWGGETISDEEADNPDDTSGADTDSETGELALELEEIKDIMKQLYRLSFEIRDTRQRFLTKKALLIEEEDPETGEDLFAAHASFDRRHVQESLSHLRRRPSTNQLGAEPAKDLDHNIEDISDTGSYPLHSNDCLADRLAKAITDRRKYFAYWRRHALKLSHITEAPAIQNLSRANLEGPGSRPPVRSSAAGNLEQIPRPKTMVSETDFSKYTRELDTQLDTETVISYATTACDVDGNSSELLPPPRDAADQSELICPYCWVACPSKEGRGKLWREHICQDLQPYLCTYEDCPDGERMYPSRHVWLEHERLVHCRIWRCFEYTSYISKSRDGLLQHFLDCHSGLDEQQAEVLLDIAEATVSDDRKACPFCFSIGPFIKGFQNHMAFHQEQFATFAIPRNIDNSDVTESGRVEDIGSAVPLRSATSGVLGSEKNFVVDEYGLSEKNFDRALLASAETGDCGAIIGCLRNRGADLESKNNDGETPLTLGSKNGHEKVVKLLLEYGADLESRDIKARTPLALGVRNGHEKAVRLLLEYGADLESKDFDGNTPLASAIENGHENVIKLLLENGANRESRNAFNRTLLALGARNGHEKTVKLLLEFGADFEWKDSYGYTPLAIGARNGHVKAVKLLLQYGADLESKDVYGNTPLVGAITNGHEEVVKLLLENGADLESKNADSQTLLALAARNGHEAISSLLLDRMTIADSTHQYD